MQKRGRSSIAGSPGKAKKRTIVLNLQQPGSRVCWLSRAQLILSRNHTANRGASIRCPRGRACTRAQTRRRRGGQDVRWFVGAAIRRSQRRRRRSRGGGNLRKPARPILALAGQQTDAGSVAPGHEPEKPSCLTSCSHWWPAGQRAVPFPKPRRDCARRAQDY
jgi:hypothetical protein